MLLLLLAVGTPVVVAVVAEVGIIGVVGVGVAVAVSAGTTSSTGRPCPYPFLPCVDLQRCDAGFKHPSFKKHVRSTSLGGGFRTAHEIFRQNISEGSGVVCRLRCKQFSVADICSHIAIICNSVAIFFPMDDKLQQGTMVDMMVSPQVRSP